MRNIRLTIEYDGTNYRGWQIQQKRPQTIKEEKTIQGIIERALSQILQEEIRLIGASRTDAGVHAKWQVANFKTESDLSYHSFQKSLNSILPKDIIIKEIKWTRSNFHARFDASLKTYRYQILNQGHDSAFTRLYHHYIPYKLDHRLMAGEASILVGRHDFKSFQAADKKEKNSIRTIKRLSVKKYQNLINIDVEADGFLYNMIRNIVGTLIEIGRGKFPPGSMKKILKAKNRQIAGPTAPAQGLCLRHVRY
jgi:tRNA pseudouridine38-40 synthase